MKIYNSLVECAGRCDEYVNNYPAKSKFKEATKDANETLWAKEFLANFKGTIASKLSSRGGITQVLMPSNKLEIVGQAGAPHKLTPTDQRGIQRSSISSTFGACDADYSAVIEMTDQGCPDHKNTRASFKSTISGLTNAMYQWVDNYNDLPNEKGSTMKNAPIGTYWLDVKGIDASGNYVTISSNEIRVSDVCEEPGIFYVKTQEKGGSDEFAGTTWDQAFQSLEKAVEAVAKYKKENGADAAATIHIAGGEYTLQKDAGLTLGDLRNVNVLGGYGFSQSLFQMQSAGIMVPGPGADLPAVLVDKGHIQMVHTFEDLNDLAFFFRRLRLYHRLRRGYRQQIGPQLGDSLFQFC